jgi:signal transduction histidine kinase
MVKVVDQGIGIPEADLQHLFEPFHRAKNVGTISGTGLGLVITKESVELHNGIIAVESQVGIGTTFRVSIPLNQAGKLQ